MTGPKGKPPRRRVLCAVALFFIAALSAASGESVTAPVDARKLLTIRNRAPAIRSLKFKKKKKTTSKSKSTCTYTEMVNETKVSREVISSLGGVCPCCINGRCGGEKECSQALSTIMIILGMACFASVLISIVKKCRQRQRDSQNAEGNLEAPVVAMAAAKPVAQPQGVNLPVIYGQTQQQTLYGQTQQQPQIIYGQTPPVGAYGQPIQTASQFHTNPAMSGMQQGAQQEAIQQANLRSQGFQDLNGDGVITPDEVYVQAAQRAQLAQQQTFPVTQAPQQPAPGGPFMTTLTVPKGYGPGKILKVKTAEGKQVNIKIPQGCQPGGQFQVDLQAAAALTK